MTVLLGRASSEVLCPWWLQVADFSKAAARQLAEVLLPPEAAEGGAAIVALLTALPFGLAAGWMLLLAKSSQMTGEGAGLVALAHHWLCADPNVDSHAGDALAMD